jgi:preprotein translocase subunit SecA
MDGRRYSDGLHQAIEAKENVKWSQHKPLQQLRYRIISECTTNWAEWLNC